MTSAMGEQPIYSTKAHVFQIDPNTKKKWLPASNQAISVSYYYDSTRKTYRIISVDGSKAVINSTITPNMTFTKTSGKFGQWSDPRAGTVYGLGFSSEADLSKFMEKFKEVKELTRQHHNGDAPVNPAPPPRSATVTNGNTEAPQEIIPSSNSPQASPKPSNVKEERRTSNQLNASLPGTTLVEQLKYENDRLKIALAQSSANAKKWEVELQTLKNNNVRLTTALQESTSNVEEWKRQLAAYKEDSARLKKRALEVEATNGGSELLQRQLSDMRDKANESDRLQKQKQEEVADLTKRLSEITLMDTTNRRLEERIKTLEREKETATHALADARKQNDQSQVSQERDRQQLRSLQEQLSSRLGEIYDLNDKLADVLRVQSHS